MKKKKLSFQSPLKQLKLKETESSQIPISIQIENAKNCGNNMISNMHQISGEISLNKLPEKEIPKPKNRSKKMKIRLYKNPDRSCNPSVNKQEDLDKSIKPTSKSVVLGVTPNLKKEKPSNKNLPNKQFIVNSNLENFMDNSLPRKQNNIMKIPHESMIRFNCILNVPERDPIRNKSVKMSKIVDEKNNFLEEFENQANKIKMDLTISRRNFRLNSQKEENVRPINIESTPQKNIIMNETYEVKGNNLKNSLNRKLDYSSSKKSKQLSFSDVKSSFAIDKEFNNILPKINETKIKRQMNKNDENDYIINDFKKESSKKIFKLKIENEFSHKRNYSNMFQESRLTNLKI